jgi:hypothetical protein
MIDGDSSLGPQARNLSDEAIRHAFDNALVQLDFDADETRPAMRWSVPTTQPP